MTSKQYFAHPDRPASGGEISSAIRCGQWVYVSGQGPLDITTLEYVPGSIEEETLMTLVHIERILQATGATKIDVVKCTCYLANLEDFAGFHAIFKSFFPDRLPCRTTVQSPLLRGIRVEIDAVAYID